MSDKSFAFDFLVAFVFFIFLLVLRACYSM
jgi:hypothetical protein